MSNIFFNSGLFNFGGSSVNSFYNLSSLYKDYTSIQNGTYKKLLKAYYATQKEDDSKSSTSRKKYSYNTNAATNDPTLTSVKKEADELVSSTKALTQKGTDSLFQQKSVTRKDETTGETTTTMEYDTDSIVKAVKKFASDYNSLLDSANKTTDKTILQKSKNMSTNTKIFKRSLSEIGITVGTDNKLTVDEDKLKQADMNDVRRVFQGSGSLGSYTSSMASMISSNAERAATTSGTYGTTGNYNTFNYSSFNTYF